MVIVRTKNGKPVFSNYGRFLVEYVIERLVSKDREEKMDHLLLHKRDEADNQNDAETSL